jgi:NAD(P)-dependent dehydrogenase (short-subunit alcohol dehydrogenase family)
MLEELFSSVGRVALVTGGDGGVGRAIALGLRAAGARVVVTGRDPAKNAQVAAELGPDSAVLTLDVRSEEAVATAVSSIVERVRPPGHPGEQRWRGHVERTGDRDATRRLGRCHRDEPHRLVPVREARCARMIGGSRGGKIINIASVYASYGPPDFAHYPSAKPACSGSRGRWPWSWRLTTSRSMPFCQAGFQPA